MKRSYSQHIHTIARRTPGNVCRMDDVEVRTEYCTRTLVLYVDACGGRR